MTTELSAITDAMVQAGKDAGTAEVMRGGADDDVIRAIYAAMYDAAPPIDMLLYCPNCDERHIDQPNDEWSNPPHRTHLCRLCGHEWRPSDTPTNGVAALPSGHSSLAARHWRYTQRPGYFALPPMHSEDLWAVGVGSTRTQNSYYGVTLEEAIDKALEHEATTTGRT